MTDTQTPPASKRPSSFDRLAQSLAKCETVTELFKLAASDEFKQAAHNLNPDDLAALRAAYRAVQSNLDGKVKLEQFDGQILQLEGVGYWHSTSYDNDGVTLEFRPEIDQSHKFKALTSSAPIVRFCNNLEFQPSPEKPMRVMVKLNPVRDAERAARGQRVWTIKRLAMPDQLSVSGSPF